MDALWRIRRKVKTQREARLEQRQWTAARRAETYYNRILRQVAAQVGQLVQGIFNPADPEDPGWQNIIDALNSYSYLIRDWAGAAAQRIIAEVDRRDMAIWLQHGRQIGRAMRAELASAPIGPAYADLLQQQVNQITGISTASAERVERLRVRSREMIFTGERWNAIVDDVMDAEDVARSHAQTIARTETARAQSTLTAVRAAHVGSEFFQWVTAGDADVRPLHHEISRRNGGVYRWDDPPILDDGRPGLPGTIWNCFLGDTLVDPLGRYLRAFRALYRGSLVVLRIADAFVRVTPNHPILTSAGWRPAGRLQEGDYVLQAVPQRGNAVEQHIDDRLLTFEQIFESGVPDVEPLAEYDFHGDAVEDKVEIVRPQLRLPFDQESVRFQSVGDDMIALADSRVLTDRIVRGSAEIIEALCPSLDDPGMMLFAAFGGGNRAVDIGWAAHRRASPDKHFVQSVAADAKFPSERVFAFSADIPGDFRPLRIAETRLESFSGHVYTLETEHGYYGVTAQRMVAKNCRCFSVPLMPEEGTTPRNVARSREYEASLRPEAAPINEAYRKGRLTYGQYVDRLLVL
jgi:SPP1 gp7 family putative phage head morphogenesis protein